MDDYCNHCGLSTLFLRETPEGKTLCDPCETRDSSDREIAKFIEAEIVIKSRARVQRRAKKRGNQISH